jgi:hypothetical protein
LPVSRSTFCTSNCSPSGARTATDVTTKKPSATCVSHCAACRSITATRRQGIRSRSGVIGQRDAGAGCNLLPRRVCVG